MPTDVELKDPRSMKVDSLVKFFKHVADREDSHGILDSFKFKSVLSSRKKGTLLPARYKDDDDAATSEDTRIPPPPRRRKRRQIPHALDDLPLLINNTDDTQPLIPSSDITAERFNGLYTPGDTPAPDDSISVPPAENAKILQLRSRLPLTPDGTEAESVSPSTRLRSRLALTPDGSQAGSVSPSARLRSRLALSPEGSQAHSVSPSAPRRSLRSSNDSSPLNPTSKKPKNAKKKRG